MDNLYKEEKTSAEIGGYFELEIANKGSHWHQNALALNNARSGFQYILKSRRPKKVYVPNYICNSMLQPLRSCGTEFVLYNISPELDIDHELAIGKDDLVLYVNYFGLKSEYCNRLCERYGRNLIIDNSQAFFEKAIPGIDSIYSARKFFGVSDGGYLYTNSLISEDIGVDYSFDKVRHLVGRLDKSASEFFADYRSSEMTLNDQSIKKMSMLTSAILQSVDYEKVKLIRERNFLYMHNILKESNGLDLKFSSLNGPMVYPYLAENITLRETLISQKVYVAQYWREVLERKTVNSFEKKLVEYLIPLPIDQRYGLDDLFKVVTLINSHQSLHESMEMR